MNTETATPTSHTLIYDDLEQIRTIKPIVHNITNFVTMTTVANTLLALGASPIMAHASNELAEIINLANSFVINIGTLDDQWIHAMHVAQRCALTKKIPIILDPVGAGATTYRTHTAKTILNNGVNIVRGNASEILSLVDDTITTKGVDSKHDSESALLAAQQISRTHQCVVVISGQTDIIVSDNELTYIHHGTPLFTKVTGMGCAVTSVIAAFCAINPHHFLAACHAMIVFGRAGELAATQSRGCGSFYTNLLDTLSTLNKNDLTSLNISYSLC